MHPVLPDFSSIHVLVAGDVMLDRYWHGATSRISPEAPVPVVKVGQDEVRAGGAGNVALNVTALGAAASLLGLTGQDEAARLLGERLQAGGVRNALCALPTHPTITKLRVISRHQQLIRLDFEERFDSADAASLSPVFARDLALARAVILSDYAKGTLAHVTELITRARQAGIPVVVDPKGTDFARYRGATVLTPNMSEFEAVAGPCADDQELVRKGEALRQSLDLTALLITRSEKGVTLLEDGHPPLHLPARAREVFDVTGAGDTVVAILGAALGAGLGLAEATALANLGAGIVVAKLGTATASVDELREALQAHVLLPRGQVSAAELPALCRQARAAGERVVLACGIGPVLDAATLAWLEAAAAEGERLVLALDEATLQASPALSALRAVDWATPCPPDALDALAQAILPETLAYPTGLDLPLASATRNRLPRLHAIPLHKAGQ